jgi:Ca2+-binding RTX toxin-like protein
MADLTLNWGLFGAFGTDMGATQTVDTGGVDVTLEFNSEDAHAEAFTYNADGFGGPEGFDANSFLKLFGEGGEGDVDNTSHTTISFAPTDDAFGANVQNVSFRINDIDGGENDVGATSPEHIDILNLHAFDADGNEVPVTITPGANMTAGPGRLEADNNGLNPTDPTGSALIEIAGPVARIEIGYQNGGTGDQRVMLTDINFSTTDADLEPNYIVEGTPGDDLIDFDYTGDPEGDRIDHGDNMPGNPPEQDTVQAGLGDDTVYAGLGDDSVFGDGGDDDLYGEVGDDTLFGGDGDDLLDGGEGDDDLRGSDGNDTAIGGDGDDVIDTSGHHPAIDVPTFPGVPVDAHPNDDRDSVDGGDGNDTITTGDDRDTIDGGAGDDHINAGIDNDVIDGGDGDDFIVDPQGADSVHGGEGNDTILVGIDTFSDYEGDDPNLPIPDGAGGVIASDPNTTDGMDTVFGEGGHDVIATGDDADYIDGGTGNDTINAGIDDDTVIGGEGDDSIIGGHGSDSIEGNDGDDWIDASQSTMLYPNEPDATDPVPTNDMDTVFGGAGNDTIFGGDDNDSLDGGDGHDVIDGGIDDDVIRGRVGDDTLMGDQGADTITGGYGDDVIYGDDTAGAYDIPDATDPDPDDNRDYLDGRQGDDTIYGGDDDDTLLGGNGNDYLDGGIDDDSITGGAGDDTLIGGEGVDSVYGESGRDTIIGSNVGDYVHGGSSPDGINPADGLPYDYDTLDLTGSAPAGGSLNVEYISADREDGIVHYFDDTGAEVGTSEFYDIENVVPCFTPGTAIATPRGERMVEDLTVGDKIITRDNGIQEIRWLGTRTLTGFELARAPQLRPILIQKGALGDNLPEHDILVSPQHRLLMTGDKAQLYFEEREVLAAAKHLTGLPGVDEVGTLGVTYVHFMFDQHEVVLSNGIWTESFQPGANVLGGLGTEQRDEIFALFPDLQTVDGVESYSAARRSLKQYEARLLVR